MKPSFKKLYLPLVFLFIFLNALFTVTNSWQLKYGFSKEVLLIGNIILFLVSIASLFFHIKGFFDKNVTAFLRTVYASLLVKMFGIVAAVIIYAVIAREQLNKPSLFFCMGLYFVYTFVEIRMVFRLLKHKNNG